MPGNEPQDNLNFMALGQSNPAMPGQPTPSVDDGLNAMQPGAAGQDLNANSIPSLSKMAEFCATRGNYDKAIEYYTPVAESQGEIAEAAREKLVRLDLDRNPGNYIQVGCYADSYGNLVVAVANATSVAIEDVRFAVSYRDSTGVPRRVEEVVRGPIGAGQRGDRAC